MPAKACHDFNNDFTLFTAVPVLFNMYTDKDSNLICDIFILNRSALHDAQVWLMIDQRLQDQRMNPKWLKQGGPLVLC